MVLVPPFGPARAGYKRKGAVIPVLGTIADLAASPDDQSVDLTWTTVPGATTYQPQYRISGSPTWLDFGSALGPTAAAVTVTNLVNDTTYDFQIVASDGFTNTESNEESATPTSAAVTDPDDLTSTTIVGVTDTTITVSWTVGDDGTGNPASATFRYGSPTIDWGSAQPTEVFIPYTTHGKGIGETATMQFTGLTPGTTYQVQGLNYRGTPNIDAVYGDIANSTTDSDTTSGSATLGTITDLSSLAGDTEVALTWTPAANATAHQPQYRQSGSPTWLDFGSALGASASGVTVTGLTNGVEYECRVEATDGSSFTYSNIVSEIPDEVSGSELWVDEPAGLTEETELDLTDETIGALSVGNDAFPGGWDITAINGGATCEVIDAASGPSTPPSGRNRVIRLTMPESLIDNAGSAVVPMALRYFFSSTSTKKGYGSIIMAYNSGMEFESSGNKIYFVRRSTVTNQVIQRAGGDLRRYWNTSGSCHPVGMNHGGPDPITLGNWFLLQWYQSKPSSFPGVGREWLKFRNWNGSSWDSVVTLFDVQRTFCAEESIWDTMLLTWQHGGSAPFDITGPNIVYLDTATWRAAA